MVESEKKRPKLDHETAAGEMGEVQLKHIGWTKRQGYILTGGGKAEEFYTLERGFPFQETELPHYHLMQGQSHSVFQDWCSSAPPCSAVCGVWNRKLFVGGWDHTSDNDEIAFNIQTHNLFIDMRIPRSRSLVLSGRFSSLRDLGAEHLRLYARQHIFAGFSYPSKEKNRPLCTRHHCIDWNFVGKPRTRPNKWWIEAREDGNVWKEHSYATDSYGQHYYSERWERIGTSSLPRLALRKVSSAARDGIIVAVGDHFNYVLARDMTGEEKKYPNESSTVDLVDAAVASGDLVTARSYLSIQGGHGTVSSGWILDCSIAPWDEGMVLWKLNGGNGVAVEGDTIETCGITWNGEKWSIYDCSFKDVSELRNYLQQSAGVPRHKRQARRKWTTQ